MDDDTLAPMADALSATLAVIVLLICFFILAQVVAVSKQIEIQKVGEQEYIKRQMEGKPGKIYLRLLMVLPNIKLLQILKCHH